MNFDGPPPHILAVSDSPDILALKREIFEEEGFQVTTWLHEQMSAEAMARIAPDLAILDYSSLAKSAFREHVATDPHTKRTPIVLCTGARREVEAMRSELDAMGVEVIHKPFDIEELVRVVREGLGLESDSNTSPPSGTA